MKKILIAEDENEIREYYSAALNVLGYAFESFAYPHEALSRFKKNPDDFWVIITDARMPGMDGNKLAEEIKKMRPDIYVIMISAFADQIGQGINKFLSKPLRLAGLKQAIEEAKLKTSESQ